MKKHTKTDSRPIKEKTLEELLEADWPDPISQSYVASNMHRLRNVPLKQYRLRDLRLMINQGIALSYLVPIALDHLEKHPLAEAELYPGDLLHSILTVNDAYWLMHNDSLLRLRKCLHAVTSQIRKSDTTEELQTKIHDALIRLGAG